MWLSRALTEPLRRAEAVTHRLADGDLSTRLTEPTPEADDELSDLARSINTMAESLERSRGVERQFLLSVSHDLRTPLTSIRGYAEAITDGTAPDPRPAAEVILFESRRLERLVQDLLELARLDAQQFSLHLHDMAVTDVVADTVAGFQREADGAGVVLSVIEDTHRATALVDPDRLAQVVANLVGNGLRYATSRLTVATVADGPSVIVDVNDDGPGIAPEDLPHVFERLYVAKHRPGRVEGSGLGLAIVRELVVAMSGTVTAESPAGDGDRGARMVVRLPGPRADLRSGAEPMARRPGNALVAGEAAPPPRVTGGPVR
ncbi:MAG: HAMP domain-containing sensor histidine kinase [Acidimicrobiales bacterium]